MTKNHIFLVDLFERKLGGYWRGVILVLLGFVTLMSYALIKDQNWNPLTTLVYNVIPSFFYLILILYIIYKIDEKIDIMLNELEYIIKKDPKGEHIKLNAIKDAIRYFKKFALGKPMVIVFLIISLLYLLGYRLIFFYPKYFKDPASMTGPGQPLNLEYQIAATYFQTLNFGFLSIIGWVILTFTPFAYKISNAIKEELTMKYISVGYIPDYLYSLGSISTWCSFGILSTMLLIPNFTLLSYLPSILVLGTIGMYFFLVALIILAPFLGIIRHIRKVRERSLKYYRSSLRELLWKVLLVRGDKVEEASLERVELVTKLSLYNDILERLENLPMIPLRSKDRKKISYAYISLSLLFTILQRLPILLLMLS